MKPLFYCIVLFIICMFGQDAFSQVENTRTRRTRDAQKQDSGLPGLTTRAESKNEDQTFDLGGMAWQKEIYRWIDLTKEENAPLYFPIYPIENRMNLFTMIFKLMCEGKIKAYEYLDGREIFTEKYEINFEEYVLKRFNILYTTEKRGQQTVYLVEESDIPSYDVTLYMIKEVWYFNQANGMFDKQILALCPMLVLEDYDMGGEPTRNPMFWIPYENIRPYISQNLIMTSNINNALTYTTDDYFRKGMYKGEIIKTTNLMNYTLQQQYGDSIKVAQDSIENQLKFFEKQLWIPEDTTFVADKKGKKEKKEKKSSRSGDDGDEKEEKKEEKKAKPQKAKTEKSSSSPTKSVRRTR